MVSKAEPLFEHGRRQKARMLAALLTRVGWGRRVSGKGLGDFEAERCDGHEETQEGASPRDTRRVDFSGT